MITFLVKRLMAAFNVSN